MSGSGARERILSRVAVGATRRTPPPGPFGASPPSDPPDWSAFRRALEAAGGRFAGRLDAQAAEGFLQSRAVEWPGRCLVTPATASRLPGLGFEVAGDAAARDFSNVSLAVAWGELAVAENGAVAVRETGGASRSLLFLAEHLVLGVHEESLVADLHAAIARFGEALAAGGRVTLVAGPSKTADIEQVLVQGAHGPRSLDVLALAGPDR